MTKTYQLVFVLTLLMPFIGNGNELPDFPFVMVQASSERKVAPDKASIEFYLTSYDQSADVAMRKLEQTAAQIVSQLSALQINAHQLSSSSITKRVKRKTDDDYQRLDILGYEVSQSLTLTLTELSQYAAVVNVLYNSDHVAHIASHFDHSKRLELSEQLVLEAGQKALRQGQLFAQSLGVQLGHVYAIKEADVTSDFIASFGVSQWRGRRVSQGAAMRKVDAGATQPQYIVINKTLDVIYTLAR